MTLTYRKQSGFTLPELVIALVVNIIVLAALVSIFVTNLQHYRKVINTNRLNQQLQTAMDIMSSDIRRAGFWSNASNDLNLDQNNNPFMTSTTDISVTGGNCILFTYDHNQNGALPSISASSDDERYGYRLNGQTLQSRPWGASFACNAAASAWENITDPNVLLITNLTFTLNTQTILTGPGTAGITIRSVDISMTGTLANDTTTTKTITEHVRIRNDKFIP
ncbi:MAG: prepilin-type N-terminal cleavage/methylation domain-containing protein [Gammaproteobacteria bacterium]|nr:prepilin-type N-terminal cleavage/methylation domain-containing protein [Gammaproteobacteria bacterium]